MLHDFEKILHYSYNWTQQKRKEQERLASEVLGSSKKTRGRFLPGNTTER
jgi:hypothetical protein